MKKLRLVLLSAVLLVSLLFSGTAVYAQENQVEELPLPDAGILPDSPFYIFDTLGKNLGLFFAFGPEAKAQKALQYAEERLAEAQVMAAKGKANGVEKAANGYDKFVEMAAEKAEEARQKGAQTDISERVASATAKHLSALDKVVENFPDTVPDQARQAISRAREASMKGARSTLMGLAQDNPEKAAEIAMNAAENRLHRAIAKAEGNDVAGAEEAANDVEKLLQFGAEISAIAQGIAKGETTVNQLIARATTLHFEVLSEVYQNVPEQAKTAIENAMNKSATARENAVERLKATDALDNISEELPIPGGLPDEVKSRLEQVAKTKPSAPAGGRP